MSKKVYIWAFPGLGKSNVHLPSGNSSPSVIDAESNLFQYNVPERYARRLHRREEWTGVTPNPEYPQNYLDYVKTVNADIVLLNCHPSLLKDFDQEELLLVFPSSELKGEYLDRYYYRQDSKSFIAHMDESFEEMVGTLRQMPFLKCEIRKPKVYLQELLDGGLIMSEFITKKELAALLEESIRLGVYTPDDSFRHKTPIELSQMMFDGEVQMDLYALRQNLSAKKEELAKEAKLIARRGGLSHEELRDKIQMGIVNGTFYIDHGQIAPYSYGYEVKFPNDIWKYSNRWECYCNLTEVADRVTTMIEQGSQDQEVFSSNTLQPVNIEKLLKTIEDKEHEKLQSFTPEAETRLERRGYHTGHVARLSDVHNGLALDGIIQGHFHGDYSTITTSSQNELLEVLVAMKGFCLDCLPRLEPHFRTFIINYLKDHGTDVSTPDKLQAWIDANPQKCGLQENRKRNPSLESRMQHANARRTEQTQSANIPPHEPEH